MKWEKGDRSISGKIMERAVVQCLALICLFIGAHEELPEEFKACLNRAAILPAILLVLSQPLSYLVANSWNGLI